MFKMLYFGIQRQQLQTAYKPARQLYAVRSRNFFSCVCVYTKVFIRIKTKRKLLIENCYNLLNEEYMLTPGVIRLH